MKHSIIDTITHLNRSLAHDFQITALHDPDAPIFLAVAWPTDIAVTGLKPRLPAGRGTTLAQAMRSAGAEAMELRASLAQNHRAGIPTMPRHNGRAMAQGRDMLTGTPMQVPAQSVYLDFASVSGEPTDLDADSTGCATGPSQIEAAHLALLECLERDAMALWWHGGLAPAALPLDLIDGLQPRLYWWLQERARQTILLDLTTDTGVPVVAAISSNPDGTLVATGTAARLAYADAALSAVTEMLQTEAALAQAAAVDDPEYTQWRRLANTQTMPQFQTGPAKTQTVMTIQAALQRLANLGHHAIAVDMTLPDDPQPTMRVVVPGLCAMQGRIDTPRFAKLTGRLAPPAGQTDIEPY
jgi:thiazole/oxazole-forming peptide maturase SagD family component